MVFTGTYDHTIDAKSRLAIPSEIRSQIQREAGTGEGDTVYLYVTLGEGKSLSVYTEKGFEKRAEDLDNSQMDPDRLLEYERLFFSVAQRVELDKQGRIRVPEQLLRRTGLGSEVVLLGVKDHIEVRDRATWYAYLEPKLQQEGDALANPRRAMRPDRGIGA